MCKSEVTLTLNKISYGMYILDLSKVLMCEFHCDYIKNKYGVNSGLVFTDIDSLIYEIKTKDVYEDLSKHEEIFDVSNFSCISKYYDHSSKLIVGEMKDE